MRGDCKVRYRMVLRKWLICKMGLWLFGGEGALLKDIYI